MTEIPDEQGSVELEDENGHTHRYVWDETRVTLDRVIGLIRGHGADPEHSLSAANAEKLVSLVTGDIFDQDWEIIE